MNRPPLAIALATALVLLLAATAERIALAATRDLPLEIPEESGFVRCIAFSPDGKRIAIGTGDEPRPVPGSGPRLPPVPPPGERGDDGPGEGRKAPRPGHVLIFDARKGKLERVLKGQEGPVDGLVWSVDEKTLCSVGRSESRVYIWTPRKEDPPRVVELPGPIFLRGDGPVLAIAPDGKRVLVVIERRLGKDGRGISAGGALAMLEVEDGSTAWTEADSHVQSILFLPKGKGILTVRAAVKEIELEGDEAGQTAWSQGPETRQFRDPRTGEVTREWEGESVLFEGLSLRFGLGGPVALGGDGRTLITLGHPGVQVQDLESGKALGGVDWPENEPLIQTEYRYSPRRGLALRAGRKGQTGAGPLHFDLVDVGAGKVVREADGPDGRSWFVVSPTIDRMVLLKEDDGPVVMELPWGR